MSTNNFIDITVSMLLLLSIPQANNRQRSRSDSSERIINFNIHKANIVV